MIQAAYWALQYATAQGNQSQLSSTLASAAKLGDYVRYSMYDKYFKQISANCSQVGSVACPAGTSKANEATYLLSWYYAFGGSTTGAWSWRISGTEIHEGYQNPLAAFALSNTTEPDPAVPVGQGRLGDQPDHAAQPDAVAAVQRGRDRRRRHQQLGRQLRRRGQAAGR